MRRHRFSGRREVAIGLGTYAVYLLVRRFVYTDGGRRRAQRNGERLIQLERRLRLEIEPQLQRRFLPRRRTVAVLNTLYVTLNVVLTVGTLMELYRRRHSEFHRLRRAAAFGVLACQPISAAFPTAPPRSHDHFVDTIRELSGLNLDEGFVAQLFNPIAAFPSIHIVFAVVTAAGLAELAPSPAARALARGYPFAVAWMVFVTANHYVLDAVGGGAVALAGLRLSRRVENG
ncbi:MAG: phosphatase PAP2 family protein [Gaiellaceae bacterium]